jgi:hypothetical protein
MFLASRDSHDVSRSNLLDAVTPLLDAASAGGDDQDLARGMRMPRRSGAWFE